MKYDKRFLPAWKRERLFKVGAHKMSLGDLVQLGFDPRQFEEITDPWSQKSHYNLEQIKECIEILNAKNKKKDGTI